MIAHTTAQIACRNKAITLSGVATTGSATLAATASGYTRTAGSFLTDGFAVGMEITASGFSTAANNGTAVILSVTATVMVVTAYTLTLGSTDGWTYVARTLVVEASAAARTLAVGLPTMRAWENVNFVPITGIPHVREAYVPGPTSLEAFGANAAIEWRPMYVLQFWVKAMAGISADGKYADRAITLFAPGTQITVGSDTLEVRADPGPYTGPRIPIDTGWSVVPVNVPLWGLTANSI